MKSMTCKQLGGACDEVFSAETFEEMAAESQAHGVKMMQLADADHLAAMNEMKQLMEDPEKMQQWMDAKQAEFEALEEE